MKERNLELHSLFFGGKANIITPTQGNPKSTDFILTITVSSFIKYTSQIPEVIYYRLNLLS